MEMPSFGKLFYYRQAGLVLPGAIRRLERGNQHEGRGTVYEEF